MEHGHHQGFWSKYIFSTDHKTIGKQFLILSIVMALFGGFTAYLIRWEVAFPNTPAPFFGLVTPDKYNSIITMHGTIMLFFVGMPLLAAFPSNFLIPLMVGARDMAFPKLNMASFWLTFSGSALLIASLFVPGGPAAGGWTGYPPLSASSDYTGVKWGVVLWLLSLALAFVSSSLGGLNYLVTTIALRAPGMNYSRLPLTVWMLLASALTFFLSVGPLVAAAFMLLMDNLVGTGFFLPGKGGEPLLWQHLFWFFGHPEVYVLFFPTLGMCMDIMAVFLRKPIFGYKLIVGATISAVALSFIVWAHHMFQSGLNPALATFFSITTILISVPFSIIIFAMFATLRHSSMRLEVPLLWVLGFLATFLIGGLTGIFLGSASADIYLHGTYFVVAHFHYTLFPSVFFGGFAAIYFWFPKMYGRKMNDGMGRLHFLLTFIFFNATFWPLFRVGVGGMVRRIADPSFYPQYHQFAGWNIFATIAAFGLISSQAIFLWNFVLSMVKGPKAEANPYEANTLEWSTASPPPHGNWGEALPVVVTGPYEYSKPGEPMDWKPQIQQT
ncbi:MAG TPA: cbb3-type cytochrome c oxidase subunit I [bacterium]|nr:cbb3-type cytochrome c oxidase subunit I [bacterium]